MLNENLLKDLQELEFQELPEPYNILCEMIGKENTLKLAQKYQGLYLYLPKLDIPLQKIRDKKIRKEFDGYNIKQLAIKYGLTEYWVRKIIGKANDENQISIFEIVKDSAQN